MPQDKDELLQALITEYAQMYMKLAVSIGVPYDDVEDIVMEAFWSFYRADYIGKLLPVLLVQFPVGVEFGICRLFGIFRIDHHLAEPAFYPPN